MLWLLFCIPGLMMLYVWLLGRKKDATVRYASLAMVKDAIRFERFTSPLRKMLTEFVESAK